MYFPSAEETQINFVINKRIEIIIKFQCGTWDEAMTCSDHWI